MEKEIDLDAPISPGAVPGLSLGSILQYAPLFEQLVADIEKALAGGSFTPPPLKFKTRGKHIELDTVIKVSP